MGYIDILIPLIPGLVLAICPEVFLKSTGNEVEKKGRSKRLRLCGFGLLAVAAIYAAIKFGSH